MTTSIESLIQRIPAGLLIVEKSGFIRSANRFLEEMLGYERFELNGVLVDELLPESMRGRHAGYREHFFKHPNMPGMGKGRVLEALRKDGSIIHVEVILSFDPEKDEEVIVKMLDVSDRVSAIEALTESQKINKTATWSYDFKAGIVYWSPELFRIFDLPIASEAPPFEEHHKLFTEESSKRLDQAVAKAIETGQPYELQLELRSTLGQRRFAIGRCNPQFDENDNVIKLLGTFQDVTELALSQMEANQAIERLNLAKSVAGIGVWEWDYTQDDILLDEQMREIYGWKKTHITYEDWQNSVHPDDLIAAEADLKKMLEEDVLFNSQFRITRGSQVRHIMAFASKKYDKVVGVNMDVTEQVLLREEARKSHNLEKLGVLAGGIAHDFNNQLASISTQAELLALKDSDSEYVKKVANRLQQSVQRATGLTRQLLTFSKGGKPIKESASIEELLRDNVEFSLRGSKLKVEFEFNEGLWNADIDSHQIGQVVQNIVINASQAVSETGGNLKVICGNKHIDSTMGPLGLGRYLEIRFIDDGPGIAQEHISNIFDPYFTTKNDGHGLGLAISHSIVERHGGFMSVISELGNGATFTILLPATDEPVKAHAFDIHDLQGKGRILVVDDMPEVLAATKNMVTELGYQVATAFDVKQAIELFDKALSEGTPFDAVVTDLTMPGSGGGLELLNLLKDIDPDVQVIICSGYANNSVFAKAQALGFAGRLNKPFTLVEIGTELLRVIKSTVSRS